jgi:lincosamide nucleotidyltransferase B/F
MKNRDHLLQRLDEIARSVSSTGKALALIGLGSVGQEIGRLDEYSDLDFFVVVQDGAKLEFLQDLSWLSSACPLSWAFENTRDGCKVLFQDGIFAEFAIFEMEELQSIPYAPGRLVWAAPGIDPAIARPAFALPQDSMRTEDWLIGEILSNLLIGLGRFRRGEKISALRFVQGYAVDRILELAPAIEREQPAFSDPFAPERRFEQRFPELAKRIPNFCLGYEQTPQSARNILEFLEEKYTIQPDVKRSILELIMW